MVYTVYITADMCVHSCTRCGLTFCSKQKLISHLNKKNKCDKGVFACDQCHKHFNSRSGLVHHEKNSCPGQPSLSERDKDKEIDNLKTALSAMRGMGETIPTATDANRPIINNNVVNINIGDITNIQNNITVNAAGSENIDYIRAMTLDGFKQEVGLTPHHSTMSSLFKLVRINEEHPENHNLLLPDRDGDMVHWKSKDGWKQTDYKEKIRSLLHNDIVNVLDTKVRGRDRDDTFYWGFIVHEIMRKCGEIDHTGLKPIYDDIRSPLHDQTMKYVKQFRDAIIKDESESDDTESNVSEIAEVLSLEDIQLMMGKLQILEQQQLKRREEKKARKRERRAALASVAASTASV